MHGTTENKRGLRAALRSMLGALLASAPAATATAEEPPMVLAKTGYLFAGGKIDSSVPGSPMTGHMYVEYFIPKTLTHPYPIVMIHGGSQTGTNFTGTPDGREGWAQYFVRRGHAVYVVDQVARGRSAHFSQSQGKVADGNLGADRAALRRAGAFQSVAAGQAAHAMARQRQARRSGVRCVLRHAVSLAGRASRSSRRSTATPAIALLDKIGPAVLLIAFAVRHLHLADRRRTAEPGQGDHRGRAERPAGLRDRVQGRAGMVRRHGQEKALGPRRGADHLRSAAQGRRGTRRSCARTSPTRPISCAAGSRPSRRASCQSSPAFRC